MVDIRVTIRKRVLTLLDNIEHKMLSQEHLTNSDELVEMVSRANDYFTVMTEDEKEFVGAVSYAIRTKTRWD